MLKERVVTAIFLALIFLSALFLLPAAAWGLFVAAIVMLSAREWPALSGLTKFDASMLGVLCAAPAVLLAFGYLQTNFLIALFALGVFFWFVLAPVLLRSKAALSSALRRRLIFVVLLVPASVAMVAIRNDKGPLILLYVMAAVWLADIVAYFVGRAIGKRKLAPKISPGKSQEGALAGVLAVVAYFVALHFFDRTVASLTSILPVILFATAFAVLSITGDLFESLLKRQAGVKDSGTILPGHGGVLDRIDSLTSTLPLAGLVLFL